MRIAAALFMVVVMAGCTTKQASIEMGSCYVRAQGVHVEVDFNDLLEAVQTEAATAENPNGFYMMYRDDNCEIGIDRTGDEE